MPASQRPEATSQDLVIGIVGCGVMGRGIAQIAALAGATVWLNDTRVEAAHAAYGTAVKLDPTNYWAAQGFEKSKP